MAPGFFRFGAGVYAGWRQQIAFGDGYADFVPAPPVRLGWYDEAAKAGSAGFASPELVIENGVRKRNGVTVPVGARWVWFRFSDERPDLEGEVMDIESIRKFASYVIAQAGWIDLNHWSRPGKLPPEMLAAGRSPEEYVIGALTGIRVSPDGVAYAEGFLWPKGVNAHADTAWTWLQMAPEKVHCSVGGPAISRERERLPDGRWITRLKLLMNHLAVCNQGVHVDTEVRTAPFGEFTKALLGGVPDEPCDGEGCVPCFIRGHREPGKGVVSAGGTGGINSTGAVPEDLEGAPRPGKTSGGARKASRREVGLEDGPQDCVHLRGRGTFASDKAAIDHMTDCLGWSAQRARDTLRLARSGAPGANRGSEAA